MNKTKIEYLDYCWNFYPGCFNGCSYCWARNRARRFNKGDFNPKLKPEMLLDPLKVKKPSRIGVCFTGDLFGDWVDPTQWVRTDEYSNKTVYKNGEKLIASTLQAIIYRVIQDCPQHTFIFLTKQPQNLVKWSPFPKNCWVGCSATDDAMFTHAASGLQKINASVKFISFEPLLSWGMSCPDIEWTIRWAGISWIILGRQTPANKKTQPELDWIQSILVAAHNAYGRDFPVFIKENLRPLLENKWPGWKLLQEFPVIKEDRC